jgi:hypothetical protein
MDSTARQIEYSKASGSKDQFEKYCAQSERKPLVYTWIRVVWLIFRKKCSSNEPVNATFRIQHDEEAGRRVRCVKTNTTIVVVA